MLFSRYGSGASAILQMDAEHGCRLIREALKQRDKDKLFMRWCVGYQQTMTFDAFCAELTPKRFKSKKECLDLVKSIIG